MVTLPNVSHVVDDVIDDDDNSNYTECDDVSIYPYVDYTQLPVVRNAFVIAYVIVVCLSLLGNLMVIWTVCANKRMRTVTNYYIVNLAVSDFLVAAIVMPLKLVEYTVPCEWSLFASDALCSFVYFMLPVFVFVSVLTLVAISVERFVAIVLPLNAKAFTTKSRTRRIILISWLVAIIVSLPYLLCKSYAFSITSHLGSASRRICTDRFDDLDELLALLLSAEEQGPRAFDAGLQEGPPPPTTPRRLAGRFRKGFFMFLFVGMYLVPAGVILYTCIHMSICLMRPVQGPGRVGSTKVAALENSKRKIVRVIIAVATSFLASWAPFYLVSFVSQAQEVSFLRHSNFLFAMLSTQLAGFTNSCINPFIYNILCDSFRSSFRSILATPFRCLRRGRRKSSSDGRPRLLQPRQTPATASATANACRSGVQMYRVSWNSTAFYKASVDRDPDSSPKETRQLFATLVRQDSACESSV